VAREGVTLKLKQLFFDRSAVIAAIGKTAATGFSRFGSFVRRRAQTSMRKGGRKKLIASPGQPPRTHEGSLRRLIWFSWDPNTRSVVIGPVPYKKGDAPRLLEFGGTVTRKVHGKSRVLRYHKFPSMGPALDAEMPNLPKAWAAAVRS
jgi:hypothetical protein